MTPLSSVIGAVAAVVMPISAVLWYLIRIEIRAQLLAHEIRDVQARVISDSRIAALEAVRYARASL
jgi:hypothetical protein